jgi:hypothetical protein
MIYHIDPTAILTGTHRVDSYIDANTIYHIAKHLATRFRITNAEAKHFVPQHIEQWAKVRRTDGGDTMYARELFASRNDSRNSSYVRVCKTFPPALWSFNDALP